jgi:hypothetical protein
MLLDRIANTGTTPRDGHPQVITVAELLGRESPTTVRCPPPAPVATSDRRRGGPWVNKATVATAVVTFGSVLAVGSTFLPHSHQTGEADTGPSTDVPIAEALSAKPPSAAPVAAPRPGAALTPGAGPMSVAAPKPLVAPKPAVVPTVPGPAVQSRPLNQPLPRSRPQPRTSGPARHAAPTVRTPQATAPAVTGGSAKSSKSGKPGKSSKPGAHRASPQRPATAGKAATTAKAAAPRGGVGGVVSGITGGLL